MILHSSTQQLFTDDGRFIKKMHCPRSRELFKLLSYGPNGEIGCSGCGKKVYDTTRMTEEMVVRLMTAEQGACLLVDQSNCSIVP